MHLSLVHINNHIIWIVSRAYRGLIVSRPPPFEPLPAFSTIFYENIDDVIEFFNIIKFYGLLLVLELQADVDGSF